MRGACKYFAFIFVIAFTVPQVATAQQVPTLYLYVNDLVGVFTSDEISALDGICYELDRYNSDELAIVIVNTTQPQGIDTFASETFEANGIGKEGLDNGVMILVSTEEALWRIEVGYGLEGILNDAKVGEIGRDNLEPYLSQGDYYAGVFYTVSALIDVLTSDPGQPAGNKYPLFGYHIDWWELAGAVAIFLFIAGLTRGRILFWIGGILTRGGFGGGRSGGGGARGRF